MAGNTDRDVLTWPLECLRYNKQQKDQKSRIFHEQVDFELLELVPWSLPCCLLKEPAGVDEKNVDDVLAFRPGFLVTDFKRLYDALERIETKVALTC